jgi:hypothetical protein
MLKKALRLFLIYAVLMAVNLVVARAIIKKNQKLAFYRAIMSDLTEIATRSHLMTRRLQTKKRYSRYTRQTTSA